MIHNFSFHQWVLDSWAQEIDPFTGNLRLALCYLHKRGSSFYEASPVDINLRFLSDAGTAADILAALPVRVNKQSRFLEYTEAHEFGFDVFGTYDTLAILNDSDEILMSASCMLSVKGESEILTMDLKTVKISLEKCSPTPGYRFVSEDGFHEFRREGAEEITFSTSGCADLSNASLVNRLNGMEIPKDILKSWCPPTTEMQYLSLLNQILLHGEESLDRTGVGTRALVGAQITTDLQREFPLLTTKKVFWKAVAVELLWFLKGDTNIKYLHDHGVRIWDEWADENGNLGNVYGAQWRRAASSDGRVIDQLQNAINAIKTNPESRRIIVNSWNIFDLDKMRLPPCHFMYQFLVKNGKLNCAVVQRSCDMFLGVPFNLASYALLTHIIAQECGLKPGKLVWTGHDVHIYNNHLEQVKEQLTREPFTPPQLSIKNVKKFDEYCFEDFEVVGYKSHPPIKGSVAV